MSLEFDWLSYYSKQLEFEDEIPLLGLSSFPWGKYSNFLAGIFDCDTLQVSLKEVKWLSPQEVQSFLIDPNTYFQIHVPSLNGEAYCLMTQEEINLLAQLLIHQKPDSDFAADPTFTQSVYRFFVLEALCALQQSLKSPEFNPLLATKSTQNIESSLCIEVILYLHHQRLTVKILISKTLQTSLSQYAKQTFLTQTNHVSFFVPLEIRLGSIQLALSEWKKVKVGDFLVLNRCFLNFDTQKGRTIIAIEGQPIFSAEIEEKSIKIFELDLFEEEQMTISHNTHDDEDEEEEDDADFDDWEDEDDEEEDESFSELDEDLFGDLKIEDEEEQKLESEEDELAEPSKQNPNSQSPTRSYQEEESTLPHHMPAPSISQATDQVFKIEQLPFSITVELTRIQLKIEEIMQLEPGNILEIALDLKQNVDLSLNGKIIAKAELIRLGEGLGVRILELG